MRKGNPKGIKEWSDLVKLAFAADVKMLNLAALHFYRPIDPKVAAKYAANFPKISMFKIAQFGGWKKIQKDHFSDGGIFDQIYSQ